MPIRLWEPCQMKAGWNPKLKEINSLSGHLAWGPVSWKSWRRHGEGGHGPGGSCWLPGRWGGGRTGSLPTSSVLARGVSRSSVMPDPRALAQLLAWSLGGRWLPQHPDPSSAASQVRKRALRRLPWTGRCTLFPCQQRNRCERIDGKLMLTGVNDGCSPPLCSGYWHGLLSAVWRHLPQPERICMSLARLENVPLEKRFWCHFKCHKYCISSSLRVHAYMCAYSLRGGIPGGSAGKSPPDNAGDALRSPGGGNCNPLQYSCLEIPFLLGNPMDRGAWRATVHGVTKSWTRLCD